MSGDLRPGATGWRAKASEVTRQALLELAPGRSGGPPQRQLDVVLAERMETWVSRSRSEELRQYRRRAVARFMRDGIPVPPESPPAEVVGSITAPMVWLLDACREGVKQTARGFLPPAVVREGAERFGWWPFSGRPRSELDVHQLLDLHEMAQRERWLARRQRMPPIIGHEAVRASSQPVRRASRPVPLESIDAW